MKNKKGFKHKNSWGKYSHLKYNYVNEFEGPIKEYKMDKEELDKYLKNIGKEKLREENRYYKTN